MYFLPGGGRNGAGFTARFRRWRSLWTASDAVRFAVAAILFTAAVLKTHQLATGPVLGSGPLESRWFLIVVVEFELVLGFWLTSRLAIRWAWWFAVATFSLFAVVAAAKGVAGEPSCGCFGRVPTSPWFALTIDGCAILGLVLSRKTGWKRSVGFGKLHVLHTEVPCRSVSIRGDWKRLTCVVATWLVAAVGLGIVAARGPKSDAFAAIGHRVGDLIIVEPDRMVGQEFELGKYIDMGHRFARGRWLVVVYRSDCPACEQLISNWPLDGRRMLGDARVAFVSVPPHASAPRQPVRSACWASLTRDLDWFIKTPLVVTVDDNRVLSAVDGFSPSSSG